MNEEYEISLSRTPDGHIVATDDPNVPLKHECVINEPGENPKPIFIHLDVIHDGSVFSIWVCDSQDRLDDPDLETKLKEENKSEIVEAIKKLEAQRQLE
jgi:hypothetical protein